jgi:hypothetical protein
LLGAQASRGARFPMDRPDEEVINVLTNCRQAMTNTVKIIAVEILLSSTTSSSFATMLDLQAMMLFGRGRLRDEQSVVNFLTPLG